MYFDVLLVSYEYNMKPTTPGKAITYNIILYSTDHGENAKVRYLSLPTDCNKYNSKYSTPCWLCYKRKVNISTNTYAYKQVETVLKRICCFAQTSSGQSAEVNGVIL